MTGRSSKSTVTNRCLALLTRLLRGAAQPRELLDVIRPFAEEDNPTEKALQRLFEADRDRLKEWFGCELDYDRQTNIWQVKSIHKPPFDLPDAAIRGLAFLQATFSGQNVPMSAEVQALFGAINQMISEERRTELSKQRGLIELDLNQRDSDLIPSEVMQAIRRGCMEQQIIEFIYRASRADKMLVHHRVEPYRYFFEGGHYYLEAHCIETRSQNGTFHEPEMRRYRMGRMSDVHIQPDKFVRKTRFKTEEIIYELAPDAARLGVTVHIPGSDIELRSDGSAIVYAKTTMLFFDLRKLLHYGANCRVIGGEAAVREMKKIAQDMAALYSDF